MQKVDLGCACVNRHTQSYNIYTYYLCTSIQSNAALTFCNISSLHFCCRVHVVELLLGSLDNGMSHLATAITQSILENESVKGKWTRIEICDVPCFRFQWFHSKAEISGVLLQARRRGLPEKCVETTERTRHNQVTRANQGQR